MNAQDFLKRYPPDGNGSLDLEGTGITSLPEGLTVGGYLDLMGTGITEEEISKVQILAPETALTWQNGKYILADEIFSEVVSHKGNIRRIKNIGRTKISYLVTDGNGRWAHGDTIGKAKNDLKYKISDRDTSKYEGLTLDSKLSLEKGIEAYRVITGACAAGVRGFIESLPKVKKIYTIREIIDLTKGQYGSQKFAKFFS